MAAWLLLASACRCDSEGGRDVAPPAPSSIHALEPLPDAGPIARRTPRRCPDDMVDVAGELCVDRYESQLVDAASGQALSPYYHPTRERTRRSYEYWTDDERTAHLPGLALGAVLRAPVPPAWQLGTEFRPRADSRAGVVPQGYMSGVLARLACQNAGKRLCREHEWVRACRGERGQPYPYGNSYEAGACNVSRRSHPAAMLHGNPSIGHRDPRLNLLSDTSGPLLRRTGTSPRCRSQWGEDAIMDMVGNLDEWVDDDNGLFVGGFYSRQTQAGCAARVTSHPSPYFDYSLGLRCCR